MMIRLGVVGYGRRISYQGLFLQKATHDFDHLSFLMDSPITRVSAMMTVGHVFGGNKPAGLLCSHCDERAICLESPQNRERNQTTCEESLALLKKGPR